MPRLVSFYWHIWQVLRTNVTLGRDCTMSGSIYSMAIRRLSINRKSLIVFLNTNNWCVALDSKHWIQFVAYCCSTSFEYSLGSGLSLMRGLEVHLSFFTKVCSFWPSLIKFCPLRASVIKERLRALHFLPCFLLLLGEPLRSTETKYLELTQDSKYWSSLQKESIFKRITSGPWGEPKKSISPPAPVEPPGFLQR